MKLALRKALGARPRSIQVQFLMESVMLSLFGGFVGVVLGVLVSMFLSNMMDIAFVLSPGAIALGVGFSLGGGRGVRMGARAQGKQLKPHRRAEKHVSRADESAG